MKKTHTAPLFGLGLLALTACGSPDNTVDATTVANTDLMPLSAPLAIDFDAPLSGTLTVSTFDSMITGPFLEQAAELFMYAHPDTTVYVSSFSTPPAIQTGPDGMMMMRTSNDVGAERRDYVSMINTELMSGRGPDVLAMDVLPFHAYATGGHLVDLRAFMEADPNFHLHHYRENIFHAVADATGQFMFPIDYDFRYLAFDSDLFSPQQLGYLDIQGTFSFDDMLDIASMNPLTNPDAHVFGMGVTQMFSEMFVQDFDYFVNTQAGTAHFDTGRFEALIDQLNELEAAGDLPPSIARMHGQGGHGGHGGGQPDMAQMMAMQNEQRFAFSPRSSVLLLSELERMHGVAGQQFMVMGMGNRDNDVIGGLITDSYGNVAFDVHLGFGINANADLETQRLAWEFIRFLSNEAMTATTLMRGFPTHIEAFETRAAFSADASILDDYLAKVSYFTSQLNQFNNTDSLILDTVRAEMTAFFDGQQSVEQTINTLQSRITLMLNE